MHKKEKEKYSEQEDVVVNEALVHFFLFVFALVRLCISLPRVALFVSFVKKKKKNGHGKNKVYAPHVLREREKREQEQGEKKKAFSPNWASNENEV